MGSFRTWSFILLSSLCSFNFSEITDNHCIIVVQTNSFSLVEVAYVVESISSQLRGDFLRNKMHSWSKCVLKKFQRGRPPSA